MKKRFAAAAVAAFIAVVFLFAQGPVQKVRLWDTDLSHSLLFQWNENDNAARTLNFLVAAGTRSFTISGDSYIDQDVRIAATPTHAGLYLESSTAAPFLKMTNESDTERDPIIQFAVGAPPVTKWTMGLDDSNDNKWKLAVGDKFGEDYDTIVVSAGEGSTPPIAEFTLIDSFTTGTYLPRGVCADANYIYYSFQDQLVKIDKTTGAELAISEAVPLNTYNMYSCVTDGTYVYVACRGTSRVRKYFCSDLTYDSTSEYWSAYFTGMGYYSGYLYVTSYDEDNVRKIRCSDMVTQWTTAFTVGAGDNQVDDPYGIAADNQYVYVQDLGNDRIVRLNASDGSWVDATAVAQTFHPNSWAMWCAGDYLYNTAPYAVNDCKVEKRNKADLSISETFEMATDYAKQGWQRDDYHHVVDGVAKYVYKYQYVSFGGAGNSHIQFRLESAYGQFNDIAILTDEIRFGVGTTIPSETIEAVGNIRATAGQFISTKATGTAPVVVSSTTVCPNLNAGLWDNYHLPALAVGDMIYGDGTATVAKLADVAAGSYLRSGGVTTAPLWSTLILPNAATAYRLPVATSANTIGELAAVGATGQYLAGVTGAIPTWADISAFEPALGNPATTGFVLSSTDAGVRSWIEMTGGVESFVDLDDAPANYTDAGGFFVKVNATENGLEFIESSVANHDLTSASHPDVNAAAPNDDDILRYDTASGKWLNEALPAAGSHDLLSATHVDTTASAVVRGDVIIGSGATPKWTALAKATAGYVLTMGADEPEWAAAGADLYGKQSSAVLVNNTDQETTIFTQVVAANDLGSSGFLRCTMFCKALNNSGANKTLTLSIKFGATTLWADVSTNYIVSAVERPVHLTFCLANQGATNVQVLTGLVMLSTTYLATTGLGDLATATITANCPIYGAACAEDTTASKDLVVTAKWSAAGANTTFTCAYVAVEKYN